MNDIPCHSAWTSSAPRDCRFIWHPFLEIFKSNLGSFGAKDGMSTYAIGHLPPLKRGSDLLIRDDLVAGTKVINEIDASCTSSWVSIAQSVCLCRSALSGHTRNACFYTGANSMPNQILYDQFALENNMTE